ncbi:MAG TPA: helix-turn-helix transcriptional regulator [Sporichthyaceae bacterium]|nr:helix-turn-helix transcriptional regulator [Sporichthyaceae bacterium]
MPTIPGGLGDYLKEQRNNAQLSIRQLAAAAGVSNPYLSQIERGIRKPSAGVLQQIAKALRISAEQLYVHAGLLDATDPELRDSGGQEVAVAVLGDPALNERQKRVLLDIYASFRKENAAVENREDEP